MPFPETTAELFNAGYRFLRERPCKLCGKSIELWQTPLQRTMPIERAADQKVIPHWSTCPHADKFRKRHGLKKAGPEPAKQKDLFK